MKMTQLRLIACSLICSFAFSQNASAFSELYFPPADNMNYSRQYPVWDFYKTESIYSIPEQYNPIYQIKQSSVLPDVRLTGDPGGMSKYKAKQFKFNYLYNDSEISCYATANFQGNSSMNFTKKSYSLKLYEDEDNEIEYKLRFGNWNNTENYLLKANWIDYIGARNIVAGRLYKRMPNTMLPNGGCGIPDGFPARLYINNGYRGIYTIVQPKKKKLFGLKDKDAVNGARLYSAEVKEGSAIFENSSALDNNWECKFPADHYDKTALNRLTEFVSSCSYEEFKSYINKYMDLDSLINYMVFSEITMNADGWRKNYNIVTYDGKLWYIRPYDLDCTFGLDFAGDIKEETYTDPMKDWINTTRLWILVKACFPHEIYQRYLEVRHNQLTEDVIINEFAAFMNKVGLDNYTAENTLWDRRESAEAYLKQISDYIKVRYEFLDTFMKTEFDHPNYINAFPSSMIE